MSLKELTEEYLSYLEKVRCLSTHTVRSYRNDLESWNYWLEEQDESYEEADSLCVRGFLADMSLRKMTASSINRRLSSLRGFYDWIIERKGSNAIGLEEMINPFKKTKTLKKKKSLPTYLTYQEFEKLVDLTEDDFYGRRDRLIMEVLYSTGCRVSELCQMNLYSLDSGEVRVMGKGQKERILFLGESAKRALIDYRELRDMKGILSTERALFLDNRGDRLTTRGIFFIIEKYNLLSGLSKKVGPHTFRHSFATSMINEGANIRMVQEMLGHSSLSTTQVYTHTGIEKIRQVHRQSHPHGRSQTSRLSRNQHRSALPAQGDSYGN